MTAGIAQAPTPHDDAIVRMAHNDGTSWSILQVDDRGGYTARRPAVALHDDRAHFVWVGQVLGGSDKRIFYRQWDLDQNDWVAGSEEIHSETGDTAIGTVRIALTSNGAPHVVSIRARSTAVPPCSEKSSRATGTGPLAPAGSVTNPHIVMGPDRTSGPSRVDRTWTSSTQSAGTRSRTSACALNPRSTTPALVRAATCIYPVCGVCFQLSSV